MSLMGPMNQRCPTFWNTCTPDRSCNRRAPPKKKKLQYIREFLSSPLENKWTPKTPIELQSTPDDSESRNSETPDNLDLGKKFGVLSIARKHLISRKKAGTSASTPQIMNNCFVRMMSHLARNFENLL